MRLETDRSRSPQPRSARASPTLVAQPRDERRHRRGVPARGAGPLVDADPPVLARRVRPARDQVQVEVRDAVADDRGVDVLGARALERRARALRRVAHRGGLAGLQVPELGDVAARLDEQVAEVDVLPAGQVRDDHVLVGEDRSARVALLGADRALAAHEPRTKARASRSPTRTATAWLSCGRARARAPAKAT